MNEAIRAAVAWWRDALKNAKQDVTDSSGSFYRTAYCAIKPLLTEEQLNAFSEELVASLNTIFGAAEPALHPEASLDVEYSPQGLLFAAARKAKVGAMYFPTRTHMRVTADLVELVSADGHPKVIYKPAESKASTT